jgi:hypothetical protein
LLLSAGAPTRAAGGNVSVTGSVEVLGRRRQADDFTPRRIRVFGHPIKGSVSRDRKLARASFRSSAPTSASRCASGRR